MPRVSVVIPTLNERENLPYVIPRIPSWVNEVILVDGDSTDGTVEIACQLWPNKHIVKKERRARTNALSPFKHNRRREGLTLRVVHQNGKGKGAALRSGFHAATGDIIVTLDADGSNDPAEIPIFVGALLAGADFAKGSRFLEGGGTSDMPFYRKLGNWGLTMAVRLLFGGHYSDLCYGFNAFWADILPALKLHSDGFEIETLINVRARKAQLRITEIPSFEFRRIYGEGRLRTIPDGWRVLKTILAERFAPSLFDATLSKLSRQPQMQVLPDPFPLAEINREHSPLERDDA
jgi:glycosyltransferase involved in cell wall biosynthesis